MSFADLYPQANDDAVLRMVRSPKPPEPQGFSVWSFGKAGLTGPFQAGFEVLGSLADAGAVIQGRKAWETEAQFSMRGGGSAGGGALRAKADELAPDPATAHTADKVVNGLTRFVSKAVGAVATAGPIGGGALLGLEEGNTTAQRLMADGVDLETAAKVGATVGAFSSFGAVLPVGGGTWARTAALAAAGGPASFMAQEGLAREILQRANYADKAAEHDPTDMLGLVLSTIPGAVVGGLHMRGVAKRQAALPSMPLEQMTLAERKALKYSAPQFDAFAEAAAERYGVPPAVLLAIKNAGEKSNPTATSPKGAQGVMQFMPATAKEIGIADATDPVQAIEGAAKYMRKLFDAYGSWDAAVAHYNGGGSQAALVRSGGKPSFKETAAYLERVQAYVRDYTATKGGADPEVEAAARVAVTEAALRDSLPDVPGARAAVMQAADELAAGKVPEVIQAIGPAEREANFRAWFGDSKVVDEQGQPLVVYHATPRQFDEFKTQGNKTPNGDKLDAAFFTDSADYLDAYAVEKKGQPVASVPAFVSLRNPLVVQADPRGFADPRYEQPIIERARAEGHDGVIFRDEMTGANFYAAFKPEQIKSAIGNSGKFDPNSASLTDPLPDPPALRAEPEQQALPHPDAPAATQGMPATTTRAAAASDTQGAAPPSIDSQRLKQIEAEQPDMRVILPGRTESMTVAEALEVARAEAADEAAFAKLVKVAADCAVSFG